MRGGLRFVTAVALASALGLVAGCGGDDGPDDGNGTGAQGGRTSAAASEQNGSETLGTSPSADASASPKGKGDKSGASGHSSQSSQESATGAASPAGSPTPGGMPTRGPDGNQESVLVNLPGPTSARCVAVGSERSVRSGTMAAGPFDDARKTYRAGSPTTQKVRLYFIPERSKKMPGITVTMKHQETGKVVTVRQKRWADADEFRFYDVETGLPRGGTWRITATAGPDRGCWTVGLS